MVVLCPHSIKSPAHCSVSGLIDWLIHGLSWLIDPWLGSIDWLMAWVDWFDWLIDWLVHFCMFVARISDYASRSDRHRFGSDVRRHWILSSERLRHGHYLKMSGGDNVSHARRPATVVRSGGRCGDWRFIANNPRGLPLEIVNFYSAFRKSSWECAVFMNWTSAVLFFVPGGSQFKQTVFFWQSVVLIQCDVLFLAWAFHFALVGQFFPQIGGLWKLFVKIYIWHTVPWNFSKKKAEKIDILSTNLPSLGSLHTSRKEVQLCHLFNPKTQRTHPKIGEERPTLYSCGAIHTTGRAQYIKLFRSRRDRFYRARRGSFLSHP